jgi:protein O-GlcNAc transferase
MFPAAGASRSLRFCRSPWGTAESVLHPPRATRVRGAQRSRDGAQYTPMKRQPGSRRPTPVARITRRRTPTSQPDIDRAQQTPPASIAERRASGAAQAVQVAQASLAADRAVAQGVPLHQAGRLAEAEACYQRALALNAHHPEALHLLGLLAHQVGRADLALTLIEQAIAVADDRPGYHLNHGAVLRALGRLDDAITAWRRALALRPAYPEAFNNLGVAIQAQGRIDEAIPCFERAVSLAPAYAEAHFNLGVAHQTDGRPDLAVHAYQAALAAQPAYPAASYNLGNALRELRRFAEAADAYRSVLALDAGHADAQNNLGVVLQEMGERDRAIDCFRRTIALQDTYPRAHTNLAHLLRERGQFDEAIQAYRRALALQPDDTLAHSGLIFVQDHHDAVSPADRLAERRAWNERHARTLTLAAHPHQNDRDPDRPLRVGYVSGDFYYHSAATSFANVILSHDPRQIEVVCYASVARPDAQTARFAERVPTWRDVATWTDAAVAEQVRADQIDILVDLGGHSSTGRLLVFARKPAPIQVTAWGYVTGTGLDAMDYLLADPVAVPPEHERWYAEQIAHLPSILCFEAASTLPAVAPAPILRSGTITFGSFNRATKLTDRALDLWGRVLAAVPGSRVVLKSPGLDDTENRARILAAFAAHAVQPDRIEILGKTPIFEHLEAYGKIDVQLDPVPHGGGATTFDGLLQGVPCITLQGQMIPERVSASFLTTLGLADLIADTPDQYVEIAARLAADPARLVRERATLRDRLLASPAADGAQYTRAVEAAYRAMWHRWTGSQETGDRRQEAGHA